MSWFVWFAWFIRISDGFVATWAAHGTECIRPSGAGQDHGRPWRMKRPMQRWLLRCTESAEETTWAERIRRQVLCRTEQLVWPSSHGLPSDLWNFTFGYIHLRWRQWSCSRMFSWERQGTIDSIDSHTLRLQERSCRPSSYRCLQDMKRALVDWGLLVSMCSWTQHLPFKTLHRQQVFSPALTYLSRRLLNYCK